VEEPVSQGGGRGSWLLGLPEESVFGKGIDIGVWKGGVWLNTHYAAHLFVPFSSSLVTTRVAQFLLLTAHFDYRSVTEVCRRGLQ
jgi:hypothetical protein